jgi:hypothetical protein
MEVTALRSAAERSFSYFRLSFESVPFFPDRSRRNRHVLCGHWRFSLKNEDVFSVTKYS